MEKTIIALIYDFDKTLCTRDMQDYGFIPNLGMQPQEFWSICNTMSKSLDMDGILASMFNMLHYAKQNGHPLTSKSLKQLGENIEY